VPVPLREESGFAFSAEEVLGLITPQTRLIILNSPANPTGGVTPREEVDRLVAGLARHPQVAILSDEIYSQMLYDGREHVSLLQYPEIRDRVIMLDGWSKTYAMTGWRLGFAVWPEPLVEIATRLAINCHSCVNAAAQHAGIAALRGPQDAVSEMMAAFDMRRRTIHRALNQIPGISCVEPAGAFYAFPNISGTGIRAKTLEVELLEQAGVATIAGTSFGRFGEGFLRLSYANSQDNIREALQRIADYLAQRETRSA
jgi:aspartate/methionine/tyrosine aminotransferase